MDHITINNLNLIKKEVSLENKNVNIIAVSKTFPPAKILPLVKNGHIHYGENKVQEAIGKWTGIKSEFKNVKLHLIGKLQTNKVKFILPLFDYIHSLDNEKLAKKISIQQEKENFRPKIFIQVNIGNEPQKVGINPKDLEYFFLNCKEKLNLDIIGLMCIPPNELKSEKYFDQLSLLNQKLGLKELSMGMSNDYIYAIRHGSTFIRIGTKIFGERINLS